MMREIITASAEAEALNRHVREHEITSRWKYQRAAKTLHRFYDLMNAAFFDPTLPQCFLSFARLARGTAGQFRSGYNAIAARYEINVNPSHLDEPLCEQVTTLLHEMVRLWQEVRGVPGRGAYHNVEFTKKCHRLGLFTTRGRGYHVGYGDPFLAFLQQHGIDTEPLLKELEVEVNRRPPRLSNSSKLKKWSCACTNVWAAVQVEANCQRCGRLFLKAR
jgi:hypothetical protein